MRGLLIAVLALVVTGPVLLSAQATRAGESAAEQVHALIRLDETVEVLRDEGLAYALDNREIILGRSGSETEWRTAMEAVYDLERHQAAVRAAFIAALSEETASALIAPLREAAVQKAIGLELSARRAFLAPGVEETAREAWRGDGGGAHVAAIAAIIEANDLVDRNSSAALNASFLFLRALAGPDGMALEEQILADVWASEEETRAETGEWLGAFMALAYAPLNTAEMAAYAALWQSEAGRALNAALFEGFEPMFTEAAVGIGRAAAALLVRSEL